MFSGPLPPDDDDDAEAYRNLREGLGSISPETLRAFVLLAVIVQAGLFAASLGVMLTVFRGQRVLGGALVVGGLLALAFAVVVYQKRRRRREEPI